MIRNVTRDFWTFTHAWRNVEANGEISAFVTHLIDMGHYASEADALAAARSHDVERPQGAPVGQRWIETRHYQKGLAPRCRKPALHTVERNRHEYKPVNEGSTIDLGDVVVTSHLER